MKNSVYRYEPTGQGIKVFSGDPRDSLRSVVCPIFPDCNRTNIFTEEEMAVLDKYPHRAVVCAKLSPQYVLDMHNLSGLSGYGRFAVAAGGCTKWLDECDVIETECIDGELHYQIRDRIFEQRSVFVTFAGTHGAAGLVGSVDVCDLPRDVSVYYLHGGMLGWNLHTPPEVPYEVDCCFGNHITIKDGKGIISLEEGPCEYAFERVQEITRYTLRRSENWVKRKLPDWERKITLRTDAEHLCIAAPEALLRFREETLTSYKNALGGVLCAQFAGGKKYLFAVGRGKGLEESPLEELWKDSRKINQQIGNGLSVESGDIVLDSAVKIGAHAANAMFGDNVFLHGTISWRYGYIGWRNVYGPLAYGMMEQSCRHMDNIFRKNWIRKGPDKGAVFDKIEHTRPDEEGPVEYLVNYNMSETFIHQARTYWEYTGDKEFAERLLPVAEGCIDREIRRLKPGKEWLFENSFNTWISDAHWLMMTQCTQASAYMYNMCLLASELADTEKKKTYYSDLAENIKRDMYRVLWQPRKGIFGYAKELRGNQLFHPEPELADIYHPAELGVTDDYQTYQMLDWIEANLRQEITDNGGRLFWSADWHPNYGDSYTHSTYELNMGEEMNISMIYFRLGLGEAGYDIFKTSYMAIFGGKDSGTWDGDAEQYIALGYPPSLNETALDFPCQVNVNGTPRRNPQFSDSISMFGRALYEGMFGIKPLLNYGKICLAPVIPRELPKVKIGSYLLDYVYEKTDSSVKLAYDVKASECELCITLHLPVAKICSVQVNGTVADYEIDSGFGYVVLNVSVPDAKKGTLFVEYKDLETPAVEERRNIRENDRLILEYPEEIIEEIADPQGLLGGVQFTGGVLTGIVTGCKGSGVFFLKMCRENVRYIRPVKVLIEPEKPEEIKVFRGYQEEFAAPYEWKMIPMEEHFNSDSPEAVLMNIYHTAIAPPEEYSQRTFEDYKHYLNGNNKTTPQYPTTDERWRSMVDEKGVVMTGEGIPFLSLAEGNYMAAASLSGTVYPESVKVDVNEAGRAAYLLITGITFPMHSHVENLRIIITYEDGCCQEYPLVNPFDIGDMWFTLWGRYHDTPANGFENISGRRGAMSSAGLDMREVIPTDTEAHILRFILRPDVKVKTIEMRIIANDVAFALMGISILK